MATESSARRAGRLVAERRRRRAAALAEGGPPPEWPELRRAILAQGGIGPSRDWDRADVPGDLYREHGKAPDLVAAETTLGRADSPPWGEGGDDDAMMRYLRRSHQEWEQAPAERRYSIADPALARRRRELREAREGQRRAEFGTPHRKTAEEQGEHARRMRAFVERARTARRAQYRRPAVGFYTDDEDVVHPITSSAARRH